MRELGQLLLVLALLAAVVPGTSRASEAAAPKSSVDAGAPAPAPNSGGSLMVIIAGSAKTATEARQLLADFDKERTALKDVVAFAPGFPTLMDSSALKGLAPGYQVVVLGFCSAARLKRAWKNPMVALEPFKPGVYARAVDAPDKPESCPGLLHGLYAVGSDTVGNKGRVLTGIEFHGPNFPTGEEWPLAFVIILRDRDGRLLDSKLATAPVKTCTASGESKFGSYRAEMDCTVPGPGALPVRQQSTLLYSIQGEHIAEVETKE